MFVSHGRRHSFSTRVIPCTSAESTGQKMKLEQRVKTYLSIQYEFISSLLVLYESLSLFDYLPPSGISILQLENKLSVLLWMLGTKD